MDQDLPGIDGRKEILAEKGHQNERRNHTRQESGGKQLGTPESSREKLTVPVAELLKAMLESELETLQRISRSGGRASGTIGGALGRMRPQQVLGQRRDQGAGQQERPDEGENDGFR